MKNIADKSVGIKIKTIIYVLIGVCTFVFGVGMAYSGITSNTEDIRDLKPQVQKIPVIETKIEFLVNGMEKLTNTKYE